MTGGRELQRHVTVAGVTYGPGDDVPPAVAAKITNPKAWEPEDDTGGESPAAAAARRRNAGTRSGSRLVSTVTVAGRTYGPDDFVPDDVAARITNPKAWEDGELPTVGDSDSDGDGEGDGGEGEGPVGPEGPAPVGDGTGQQTEPKTNRRPTRTK